MKNILFSTILILTSVIAGAEPYIADQNGGTVNPGDAVYIYGVGDPEGFSLDFPREIFMEGGSIQFSGGSIFLGTLRGDISGGYVDTVLFNTQFGTLPIPLAVINEPSSVILEKQNLKLKERIKGRIIFGPEGNPSGRGIDSVFVRIEDLQRTKQNDYLIASSESDSLLRGKIDFDIEPAGAADDYFISVTIFSFGAADTFKDIKGFTTVQPDDENEAVLIIDSDDGGLTEELLFDYYRSDMYVHPVFFRGDCIPLLSTGRYKTAAVVSPGGRGMLTGVSGLSALFDASESMQIFMFISGTDTFLSTEEEREACAYFEMMMGIEFSPDSECDYVSEEGMSSLSGFRASKLYDTENKRYSTSKAKGNLFLYTFIPDEVDAAELERISQDKRYRDASSYQVFYGGMQNVLSDEGGNAEISFYSLCGKFERSIGGVYLEKGDNSINLNRYMRMISEMDDGCYIFKIEKEGVCLKCGKVIFVR